MTGQLNEHPLAELIREISAESLSGALRLSLDRAKVVIYFDEGEIINAASNLRAYRLSECLRRWGALTDEQMARAQENSSDQEFGAALLEAGALTLDALAELKARQVSEMLCHALLWTSGEWEFDPRVRVAEGLRVEVKVQELLMERARRLSTDFISTRFARGEERIAPVADSLDGPGLLPEEAFVMSRVDAPLSLAELLAVAGLPEAETLKAVYTLAMGGYLRREDWPRALSEKDLSKARAVRPAQPKSATEPPAESKRAPAINEAPAEEHNEMLELDALFARLKVATNFYEVLGVVRTAKDAEIKRIYHSLAKRFHPDRFRRTVDEALHSRIESAFAQIAQAYETLRDKQLRASYDTKLLRLGPSASTLNASRAQSQRAARSFGESTARAAESHSSSAWQTDSGSATLPAEEIFKQGLAAMQSGNRSAALASLAEAARLDPTQPRYRAYYGQALAGDERMKRSAEAEIKAAIGLDDKNPTYHVMLAELYSEIGLQRRAQGELERALSIDPYNEPARRLLLKLKGKT